MIAEKAITQADANGSMSSAVLRKSQPTMQEYLASQKGVTLQKCGRKQAGQISMEKSNIERNLEKKHSDLIVTCWYIPRVSFGVFTCATSTANNGESQLPSQFRSSSART